MGNRTSCSNWKSDENATIRILHANGSIKLVKGPIKAGEFLQHYPGYWICHSEAFYIGKPIQGLPPREELKLGHTYFLLPRKSFQSALTVSTVASFISKVAATSAKQNTCTTMAQSNVTAGMQAKPFKIVQRKGNSLQVKISANFLDDLVTENSCGAKRSLCNSYQLMEDYTKLVSSRSRPWKPKLTTITESDYVLGKPNFFIRLLSI